MNALKHKKESGKSYRDAQKFMLELLEMMAFTLERRLRIVALIPLDAGVYTFDRRFCNALVTLLPESMLLPKLQRIRICHHFKKFKHKFLCVAV